MICSNDNQMKGEIMGSTCPFLAEYTVQNVVEKGQGLRIFCRGADFEDRNKIIFRFCVSY